MSVCQLIPSALAVLGASLLSGCSSAPEPRATPAFYDRLDQTGQGVDPASSLGMLNQYRANQGARGLVWDPALARIAQEQANRMASLDRVQSNEEAKIDTQLKAAGVPYRSYVTNLSAGYRTFAEAFSGWRELKAHNANMINPAVSRIGLATASAPGSKYKIFWAMVLVEPM
ncbi:CAP domain-containing protein [Prosthecomicrobium sp. N25]|uniref:CAP domain-containing protein n=1 Tax=Prosthecomicrobium sp. N25 TaxID=3129254 RepID=UPI003076F6FC